MNSPQHSERGFLKYAEYEAKRAKTCLKDNSSIFSFREGRVVAETSEKEVREHGCFLPEPKPLAQRAHGRVSRETFDWVASSFESSR